MACCRCAARVLEAVAEGSAELMVASHNQETVALATRRMHELGLQPSTSGETFLGHALPMDRLPLFHGVQ